MKVGGYLGGTNIAVLYIAVYLHLNYVVRLYIHTAAYMDRVFRYLLRMFTCTTHVCTITNTF